VAGDNEDRVMMDSGWIIRIRMNLGFVVVVLQDRFMLNSDGIIKNRLRLNYYWIIWIGSGFMMIMDN